MLVYNIDILKAWLEKNGGCGGGRWGTGGGGP